jgi:hypothetical protein
MNREDLLQGRESRMKHPGITSSDSSDRLVRLPLRIAVGLAAIVFLSATAGRSQQDPPPRTPHPILLPEANHLPDVNDQMVMKEQNKKKKDYSAANAERKRQMDDESAKLLILAKDLKTQTDNLDGKPLPPRAVREAEVIELLAHDLKEKMKMTIGGG